jgi:two-component system, NtrC family, nitrogen regulation response regulator GlnG
MSPSRDPSENLRTDTTAPTYRVSLPGTVRLVVVAGRDQGRQIQLGPGVHQVGKADGCALVLSDPAVSRHHLELEVTPGGVVVRDLGSTNGSFLDGTRFVQVVVGVGAVVEIGATALRLSGPEDTGPGLMPSSAERFGRLVGRSRRMREVYALVERIAAGDTPLLVEGETGTGKELCAEALHAASPRAPGPFVICDLGGVSRALLESELFGHVRGAFTGADRDRKGLFAEAHGGTLFLDEIGELELEMQPRLLRAIAERRVRPVGASAYRDVDVRVVAATNRDLREEVRAGRFREDLYHRLAVVTVRLPPLRERKEDLPLLVPSLLQGAPAATVPEETLSLLAEYDWPGNVRELKNVLERARSLAAPAPDGTRAILPGLLGLNGGGGPAEPEVLASFGPVGSEGYREAKERLIVAWERQFVTQLLKRTGGNIARAAREGGIDRGYLHRLIKKLGLE